MTTPPSFAFRKKLDDRGIRRRLFQSPKNSKCERKKKIFEDQSILFGGNPSKSTFYMFGLLAIVVLLSAHVYLLNSVMFQTGLNNSASDGGGGPVNSPLQTHNNATMKMPADTGQGSVHSSSLRGRGGSEKTRDVRPTIRNHASSSLPVFWPPATLSAITPLKPRDREEYTIRINTWKRNEQLILSVNHHASCPGVAQVQVIWCDPDEEPPQELLNHPSNKVIVERHVVNSLNARFDVQSVLPTLGVLSIDDDVLRPCEALDAGFFKWTQSPHRMVGYDGRLHVENDDGSWAYGYMSTMEKENMYSLSLTRYCFLHRDYLDLYTNDLPRTIYNKVADSFNCEDIAMSFMISSLTNGQPPLLADMWAIKSMVKMYTLGKISGTKQHKSIRDDCVNSFAELLGLKVGTNGDGADHHLQKVIFRHPHDSNFECGAPLDDKALDQAKLYKKSDRLLNLEQNVKQWHDKDALTQEMRRMMSTAAQEAFKHGLIEHSEMWKERFNKQ